MDRVANLATTAKGTLTALAVGAVLGFGVVLMVGPATVATVAAQPNEPATGCEVPAGANSCEGPPRADGSRMRCSYAPMYRTGGTLIPEIKSCQVVPGPPPQPAPPG